MARPRSIHIAPGCVWQLAANNQLHGCKWQRKFHGQLKVGKLAAPWGTPYSTIFLKAGMCMVGAQVAAQQRTAG